MSEHIAESGAPRRRTEAEARRCSQEGCPGDGRYQPPGKGHMPDCQHNAVTWVWETVTPPAESDAVSACVICGHRVVWHHDERGCQYHGNGPSRCQCRRNGDQVVARIVYQAILQSADRWLNASVDGNVLPPGVGA